MSDRDLTRDPRPAVYPESECNVPARKGICPHCGKPSERLNPYSGVCEECDQADDLA